jgi:hypothetical protein
VKRRGGPRRLSGYTAGADCKSGNMADTSSTEGSQQFSTHVSRRRVVTGAVTLAVAGASSPAFAQSTDRSPNMPDNIRFSNPDTMQKPPGYSHVVEVTPPRRSVSTARRPCFARADEVIENWPMSESCIRQARLRELVGAGSCDGIKAL